MPVDRFSGRQSPTPPTPSRRGLRWPWLALSALLAGAPSSARASACASSCSSYENVSIEVSPSLDCLSVDWVESTCTCQVSLKLTNNCEEDIELDASIDTCWDTKEDPCSLLRAGKARHYSLDLVGSPYELPFKTSQQDHRVVARFERLPAPEPEDAQCSAPPSRVGGGRGAGGLWLFGAAASACCLRLLHRRRAGPEVRAARGTRRPGRG